MSYFKGPRPVSTRSSVSSISPRTKKMKEHIVRTITALRIRNGVRIGCRCSFYFGADLVTDAYPDPALDPSLVGAQAILNFS